MKLLFLAISGVLSCLGLLQTVIYSRFKKRIDRWPVVSAEVTHSKFLNQMGADGSQLLEGVVFFKYQFRGKEYTCDVPALRGYEMFPSLEFEKGLVSRYPKGELFNARVNPVVPEIAYLEVAPLSRLSTILAPILMLLSFAYIAAYFYGFSRVFGFFS